MKTTLSLLLLGTPLAWWLARSGSRLRAPIEAVVALPLVLPPTVLGFYLLLAMGPNGPLSGLSMAVTGTSSPASGGEHLLSHYWDMTRLRDGLPANQAAWWKFQYHNVNSVGHQLDLGGAIPVHPPFSRVYLAAGL